LNIESIPAPTDFNFTLATGESSSSPVIAGLLSLLPDAGYLARNTQVLREYIGIIIYRLKGWL
jgi:hypothetical protein